MAIVAPGVEYRQLSGKSRVALAHDIICVHTMVGTLEGSISWASRPGNSYWHFGIGGGGKTVQCQDLQYRSAANLNGNWHVIPIETADINEGWFPTSWQNPPWTNPQIGALVNLISWLCVRFNIPPVVISDTRPGRRGLAYHRQGVDPWRVSGGELWSSATGKICPANRIDQFLNTVVPAVRARVLGAPAPTPQPVQEDEDVYLLYHPKNTFWQIGPGDIAIQISDDAYNRMKRDADTPHGLPAFALQEPDCDAIIGALNVASPPLGG